MSGAFDSSPTGSENAAALNREDPGANHRSPRLNLRRRTKLVALAVSVLVVAIGVSSYVILSPNSVGPGAVLGSPSGPNYPSPPSGWVTLHSAWSQVSGAFSAFANGSWRVSFAEGVAADGNWSPPAYLWALYSPSAWTSCEAQLSGVSTVTFWNASVYPASSSPTVFSSGAAPLWTFVFSDSNSSTFVASWFLGNVILNGYLTTGSPCLKLWMFNSSAWWTVDPSHELDSNAIASEVQAEDQYLAQGPFPPGGGFAPMPVPPEPSVALYFPGQELLPSEVLGASQWTVAYTACGLSGSYGQIAPYVAYLLNATAVPQGHSYAWLSSRPSCYDSDYDVNFTKTTTVGAPTNLSQYFEWKLNVSFMTSAVPARWNLSDLSASDFQFQLGSINPPFGDFNSSAELCGPGSSNLTSCPPPAHGWYAVLLSSDGTWLDSFPTAQSGSNWSLPGVGIESGDQIAFVGSNYPWGSLESLNIRPTNEPWIWGGAFL